MMMKMRGGGQKLDKVAGGMRVHGVEEEKEDALCLRRGLNSTQRASILNAKWARAFSEMEVVLVGLAVLACGCGVGVGGRGRRGAGVAVRASDKNRAFQCHLPPQCRLTPSFAALWPCFLSPGDAQKKDLAAPSFRPDAARYPLAKNEGKDLFLPEADLFLLRMKGTRRLAHCGVERGWACVLLLRWSSCRGTRGRRGAVAFDQGFVGNFRE